MRNNKKIIWIINHYAKRPKDSGSTRHYDLAKYLIQHNYDVKIFASSFSHSTKRYNYQMNPEEKVAEETYNGVNFIWIKTNRYKRNDFRRIINILIYSFRAFREGKKRKEQPDLIIGTLMHPLAALVGYLLARKKGSTFYFEERDLWPQTLIDLGVLSRKNPIVWILSKLELYLYKKAKRIIVLFDKAINYVEQRGIDRRKVLYLPNGVDISRFESIKKPLSQDLKKLFSSLDSKFIAIYIGSHGIANHLDPILDTAKTLKDKNIHFLLVGEGPEKTRLIDRKDSENISNITFVPPVTKEEIPSLLKRADIGLISMRDSKLYKWGFSLNKMYDYMAAKLPIVLLSNMRNTEIEEYGSILMVKDSESMSETIMELNNDKSKVLDMGEKGFHFVKRFYSWKVLSDRLIDIMRQDLL